MDLYEKNGNILYILNVLKKYSDENHLLKTTEIREKIKEIYDIEIDTRTIRRNINLLKYKLDYDISTRDENGKGYYISKDPETDFEQGEIRAIIDTFSYASYIVPSVSQSVIKKCKNLQNVYENEKLKNYEIFALDNKTQNMEVIKNIEDISEAIHRKCKIKFEYWKYVITNKLEAQKLSQPTVSPFAIVYNKQQFYLIGIKEGKEEFYYYRLDRLKNIQLIPEKITIKKSKKQIFDYAKSTVEMFGGKISEIEAEVNTFLLDEVLERFGRNITIIKVDDDKFKLIVDANEFGFRMWAMRNIDFVEVIKPLNLRNEIKEILEKALKRYE